MRNEKDLYYVAVKVFLEDEQGNLLIIKDRYGEWDLPGGCLRPDDFSTPLKEVAERKIRKELGSGIRYCLHEPIVFMRHERNEVLTDRGRANRRIFAIGYRAEFLGGEIALGQNHLKYEWVALSGFDPKRYFTGGWRKGVEEYLALRVFRRRKAGRKR